jgi:putative flippase GtrA
LTSKVKKIWVSLPSFVQFAVIGGLGFILDTAIFNLIFIMTEPHKPIVAKFISTIVAIIFNWIGNRKFAFTEKTSKKAHHEFFQFAIATLSGLVISLGITWGVNYPMKDAYTWVSSNLLLINNIANVVGLVLGSISKYILYKHWVFKDKQ